MKKIYKIILGLILTIFIILISIPFLFEDKIVDLVKTTVNNNINATVDFEKASLSLLANFPNASLQISNTSIINKAPFEGDTLAFVKDINLELQLTELFKNSSDQLNIKSFAVDEALVNVLIDKHGNANYDITIPSKDVPTSQNESNEPSSFGLSVNAYAITNSTIKYFDEKGKTTLELTDFNHSGKGDFSQKKSELNTNTATLISFGTDGSSYLKDQKLQLDAILEMDLTQNKFSFLKNELKLNNLPLIFDGFVKLSDNNQFINLNFKTPSSSFKNFLAVILESYTKSIANVATSGNFSVNGTVNGTLDEKNIPKLNISIASKNASFKYPDLPKGIQNINIDAQLKNTTGKLENTFANINNLSFRIDEDVFSSKATISNITSNPKVNATVKGVLNLAKINQAYPVDLQNELSGIVKADLHTVFDINAIQNNQLNRIKNNGKISVSDFVFSSKDVVNTINIKETEVTFKPQQISLTKFNATTGKSDLNATGTLHNLLGFLLSDKKLQGNLNVKSNNFYVSDFMEENTSEDNTNQEEKSSEKPTESLKIPAFLDCTILADAKNVYYDNLKLNNVKGTLLLKDEKAILKNVDATVFNGKIALNGEVNTQQKQPTFAMKLDIKSFDISQSFKSLDLLQSLSPIASAMNGKLNSDIDLSGNLNSDFTPNLTSLSGNAFAALLTTKINPKQTKALSLLNDKLSFIDLDKINLSDIKTYLSFKNGNVVVKPFSLKYKDIGINVGGSHNFNQSMDYKLTFDVPAKYLGNDVQGLLAKLNTKEQNITVPITANVTGNMTNPSIKTDLASSVTKLSQKLIQQQKEKLVSNTISKLLPGSKKDSSKTSDKNVKKVTDALGKLFGRKKKQKKGGK